MSKILKSFGMAALLVALLAGNGAAITDTTAVSGDVPLSYDIEAPGTIILTFAIGSAANNTTTGAAGREHLSVTTNGAVTLYALEVGSDGKMQTATNATQLAEKLSIKAGGETPVMLSGAAQAVKVLAATNTSIVTDFGQYVGAGDAQGAYTITVTFQGVAS